MNKQGTSRDDKNQLSLKPGNPRQPESNLQETRQLNTSLWVQRHMGYRNTESWPLAACLPTTSQPLRQPAARETVLNEVNKWPPNTCQTIPSQSGTSQSETSQSSTSELSTRQSYYAYYTYYSYYSYYSTSVSSSSRSDTLQPVRSQSGSSLTVLSPPAGNQLGLWRSGSPQPYWAQPGPHQSYWARQDPRQPYWGQPGPPQLYWGQPGPNQPFWGQPAPNQPFWGQPAPNQPFWGQPGPNQPFWGQPGHSQPFWGQPGPSQPVWGQPGPSQPLRGQLVPSQPNQSQLGPREPHLSREQLFQSLWCQTCLSQLLQIKPGKSQSTPCLAGSTLVEQSQTERFYSKLNQESMRPLQIRPAEARDCPEIMRLIKELATCDNKRSVTHLTIAGLDPYCPHRLQKYGFLPPLLSGMENCRDLLRDGFGDNPLFYCLIAEVYNSRKPSGRTAVGFAIYYFKYTLWTGKLLYLEDFYVIKAYQGLGIGDEMLKRLSQIALRTQCKGMHFLVVIWNRASAEYYCRRGASDISSEEGRHLFKFTHAQLTEIAK